MTELVLVRHGQTDWNAEGRFQGQLDMPLNARGLQQAAALAKKLAEAHAGQPFRALYSSDLRRACQTAEQIGLLLHLSLQLDERLREIDMGSWEGMLVSDTQKQFEGTWEIRRTQAGLFRAPGGESVAEVAGRMAQAADTICAQQPVGPVLVVSHGLALSTLYCLAKGISLAEVYSQIVDNATPMRVDWPS